MNESFTNWWLVKTTLEQVYWIIATPSTIMFVFIIIMTFLGGDFGADIDGDLDVDGDIDVGDGIPFQFLTIKNLVGFFSVFSWTGLAFIKGGYSVSIILLSSTIAGILMMLAMTMIFFLMSKLTESGNVNLNKSIGSVGEVYLIIKRNRKAMGKVQVKIEESFQTLDALTDQDTDIKTGSLVDIIDITNNNILIVKQNKS